MKATGIVRKLDHLGRVVVPAELRRTLNICEGDAMEFYVDSEGMYIRKFDRAADMEQVLDNFERVVREKDYWLDDDQLDEMLAHIRQMREIVKDTDE